MKFQVTTVSGRPVVRAIVSALEKRNQRIVLGSPKGGCGKTASTTFVASAMAAMGADVLLVEMTEGQAPLTHSFAYNQIMAEDGGQGIGRALYNLIGMVRADDDYRTAYNRILPKAREEAKALLPAIRKIRIDPNDPTRTMDFLPCAESFLSQVANNPRMQQRPIRRAILDALMDALAKARLGAEGRNGWDAILFDVLPSAESPIMKAAMGVADAYALLVDMESAQPLPGWGVIQEELNQIESARKAEGKPTKIFRGLILNKVNASAKKARLTERVNRARINLIRHIAIQGGEPVNVIAEVRHLNTLALLGFNIVALDYLAKAYPGGIPENLDNLTDQDIEHLVVFSSGMDKEGNLLEVGTGSTWLAAMFPSLRRTLIEEEQRLMPLVLSLAGTEEDLLAYANALPELDEAPAAGQE
jgi:cellulose biosynthesis protein BcsQ